MKAFVVLLGVTAAATYMGIDAGTLLLIALAVPFMAQAAD